MLASLLNDVRYAVRGFARRPLFAAVVVLTLALGIGVNVAMFSIFEQVLLRPLPVPEPERLVNLSSPGLGQGNASCNNAGDCNSVFSYPMFRELERKSMGHSPASRRTAILDASIAYGGQTYAGYAMLVSGSYFPVLGLAPALGRLLGPDDDTVEDKAAAVVLSHEYWRNALGADPGVVGKTLVVNGKPLTIVGVVPEQFHGTTIGGHAHGVRADHVPLEGEPECRSERQSRETLGLPIRAAQAGRLDRAGRRRHQSCVPRDTERHRSTAVEGPQRAGTRGVSREEDQARARRARPELASRRCPRAAHVLIVATGLVLLIACVNVANLMLVRGAGRASERSQFARSLGASPLRIAALLTVEVSLLAALAAFVSVPLTAAALRGIVAFVPSWADGHVRCPRSTRRCCGITAGLALASALLFGIWPALKLARTMPGQVLRTEGTRTTSSKAAARFRAMLTTAQIGLSMALLVLAGWLAQSLVNATRVDLGIRTDSLDNFRGRARAQRLHAAARGGAVRSTGARARCVTGRDLRSFGDRGSAPEHHLGLKRRRRRSRLAAWQQMRTSRRTTSVPVFSRRSRCRCLSGRDFTEADSVDRPKVAIVNERFLAKFGLDRNAVGKRMSFGQGGPLDVEIVGVARDAKYSEVKNPTPPQVFAPRAQLPATSSLSFYVRGGLEPLALRKAVEHVLAGIDPSLPLVDFRTMQRRRAREPVRRSIHERARGRSRCAGDVARVARPLWRSFV